MLFIDGVKYELWTPTNEDEFERLVKEHTQDIFGEQCVYLVMKEKLRSISGIGSIPDGFAIIFGDLPQWYIVEVELSSHPLDDHIASQVRRFITGVNNWKTQQEIARAIYEEVIKDSFLKLKVEQAIKTPEIYKFLAELISKQPILTIIIEKNTQELREVLSTIRYPQEIKVVEFQTFTREGVGLAVHAHLSEPLYKPRKEKQNQIVREEIERKAPPEGTKVTAGDFTHKGNGIFVLKSNPSVTIDVKKPKSVLAEQLAKQHLWTKNLIDLHYFLRKKAGLLNTPTEK